TWVVAIAAAFRIFQIARNITTAPVHTAADADESVIDEIGLADQPEAARIAAEVEEAERARAPIDRRGAGAVIAPPVAIHVGRMRTDATMLGLISPAVAVLGDMLIAIVVTLLVLNPLHLLWRRPTRWIERRMWRRHLRGFESVGSNWVRRALDAWLRRRL